MCKIDDLIGIPYKDNGRDLNGIDCYGLVLLIAERNGIKIPDLQYTNCDLNLSDEYVPTLPVKETNLLEENTILEMECKGSLHLGIAINKKEFIHATKNGVRINKIGALKIRKMYKWDL